MRGVTILVLIGLSLGASSASAGALTSASATTKQSFDDAFAKRTEEDGTISKGLAIAAFEAAFGNLPGKQVERLPKRGIGRHEDGTYVVLAISGVWDELSAKQRRAVQRILEFPNDVLAFSAGSAPSVVPTGGPPDPAAHQRDFDTRIADAQRLIEGAFGRRLTLAITWDNGPTGRFTAVATPLAASGAMATFGTSYAPASCRISFRRDFDPTAVDFGSALFVHEVWHCFQFQMIPSGVGRPANWIIEGQAEWVNNELRPGHVTPAWSEWSRQDRMALSNQPRSLFQLEYNAVGFYQSLRSEGINPWTIMEPMLRAGSNSVGAFNAAAGARGNAVLTASARARVQEAELPSDWSMRHAGYRSPVSGARRLGVTAGGTDATNPQTLTAYSTESVLIEFDAPVLEVQIAGAPQGAIVAAGGRTTPFGAITNRTFRFCLQCTCPSLLPVPNTTAMTRGRAGVGRVGVAIANPSMAPATVTVRARGIALDRACEAALPGLTSGTLPRITSPPTIQQAVVQALELFDDAGCGATSASVQANVNDDNRVASVILSWSFDTGSGPQQGSAPMSLSGGDLYVGTFGPFASFFNPRTTIAVTITATDTSGISASATTPELDLVDCP